LIPVWLFGIQSSIGLFYAILTFLYPFSALFLKTSLLQPIQSNLFAPELSFRVMTIGMAAASAAAVALHLCKRRLNSKPLFKPLSAEALTMLCYISVPVAILGLIGRELPGGVGRISALTGGMIFLSTIAAIYLALIRSNGRNSLSPLSILLLISLVIISFGAGAKQGVFATAISYFLSVFLYRNKLKQSQIILIFFGSIILLFIVAPAINIARDIRDYASPLALIDRTYSIMAQLFTGDYTPLADITNFDFDDNTYYIRYISDTTSALDRFAFVSYIDAVLRFASDQFLGYGPLLDSLSNSLIPNLFNPGQKELASNGDLILRYFGVFDADFNAQITLPVFGEGYLSDGDLGIVVVTFPSFLLLGAALVFIFGDLRDNVFGIWWISLNSFVFAGAGASSLAFFVIRILPIYIILYFIVIRLTKSRSKNLFSRRNRS
jgi:hypothetical protein